MTDPPTKVETNLHFAGKLIRWDNGAVVLDRLGGVVKRSNVLVSPQIGQTSNYYPFGEERTATGQGRTKFATYYRDSSAGFDYAMNRYYNYTWGRFLTPDPYPGSAKLANPQSWNRYAYVANDPVNQNDPSGLIMLSPMYFADKSMGEGWLEWLLKGPPQLTQHFYITDAIRNNHDKFPGAKLVEIALADPKCAKALGFGNSTGALSKFLYTWIENKDLGSVGIDGPNYTYKYGATKGGIIFVNNNSAFVNLKAVPIPVEGAYPANLLADTEKAFELMEGSVDESVFEAIYIAHELGHIGNGLKKDENDKDLSGENT